MMCSPRTVYCCCSLPTRLDCNRRRSATDRRLVWFAGARRCWPPQNSLIVACAAAAAVVAAVARTGGVVMPYARLSRRLRILGLRQLEGSSFAKSLGSTEKIRGAGLLTQDWNRRTDHLYLSTPHCFDIHL